MIRLKVGVVNFNTPLCQCYYSSEHHFTQDWRTSHYRTADRELEWVVRSLWHDKILNVPISSHAQYPVLYEQYKV